MTEKQAVEQVIKAWTDSGPRPDVHQQAQLDLHRSWPKLAGAVATLVATVEAERARAG